MVFLTQEQSLMTLRCAGMQEVFSSLPVFSPRPGKNEVVKLMIASVKLPWPLGTRVTHARDFRH